jgi:Protein of unknown function (DUF2380)
MAKSGIGMKFLQVSRLLFTVSLIAAHPVRAEPLRAAVFDFTFYDTSLQGETSGPRTDEQARLQHLNPQLRTLLAQSGRYEPVDMSSVETEAHAANLYDCGECQITMARKVGAQVAVAGLVQKVSNLILNMNVVIRDVATGRVLRAQSVDIRGNTDETWSRGLSFLVAEMFRPRAQEAP